MVSVRKYMPSYLLMLPFLILYLIFTFYPIVRGFIISLQKFYVLGTKRFVGLANYNYLLHDSTFLSSIWHTVIFVVFSVPLLVIIPFCLALIVNAPIKGRKIYQAIFFLPMILGVSVVSSVWSAMLGNYGGLVDAVLNAIGIHQEINWTAQSTQLAWISVLAVTVWWTAGFNMVLYLAALQDIPKELYEAASLDGASGWAKTCFITLPSVKRVTILIVFLQFIASFNVFGQIFLLTGGGPAGATTTIVSYIYEKSFSEFLFGPGAAASYILFFILLIVSLIQLRLMSKTE
ncbi:MAG: sugar ABC transporter permease [Alicyclobacillus shizuokensis]|nr:sugar ABC transporter permease [Alicyclobacillus shizuokensis]